MYLIIEFAAQYLAIIEKGADLDKRRQELDYLLSNIYMARMKHYPRKKEIRWVWDLVQSTIEEEYRKTMNEVK